MNTNKTLFCSLAIAALGIGSFVAGCGDDTTGSGGSGGTSASSTSSSKASSSSGTSSSSTGASSSSGGGAAALKKVNTTELDPTKSQLPEGLALSPDKKKAYMGYALTGEIVQVDLATGVVTHFGNVPAPLPPVAGVPQGLVLGLATSAAGDVYVGEGSFAAGAPPAGIYKIPAAGGDAGAVPFAKDAKMNFPNGLIIDAAGTSLYVADAASGSVFKITLADGKTTEWVNDPLLKGDKANVCASIGTPFAIGANGIVIVGSNVIVGNTDKASLVKIPIKADGSADVPALLVTPPAAAPCPLTAVDGITADGAGNILAATNAQNALYKVTADGKTTTKLVEKGVLDFPASIVFVPGSGTVGNEVLVTSFALGTLAAGGMAKPSLVSYGPLN